MIEIVGRVATGSKVTMPKLRDGWHKPPLFLLSLLTFVLGIYLMKEGAGALGPLVRDRFQVTGFADGLGFGWLMSYAIMSGSPVAGAAMAFLDAGVVDRLGAYGMVVGSRFGASFIVLFIGFVYVLRGRDRSTSLSMGLLSLLVAASVQVLAIPMGLWLVAGAQLERWPVPAGARLDDGLRRAFGPLVAAASAALPDWGVFVLGLAVIFGSFKLFDLSLPQLSIKQSRVGRVGALVYRPWVMFLLGAGVTLISMSVSISLGLLVPLGQRGLVRRENVVPYMMGANVSTFIDTLLAAILIGNAGAMGVVAAEMLSLSVVSTILLLFGFARFERWLLAAVDGILASPRNLAAFMVAIFALPLVLLLT